MTGHDETVAASLPNAAGGSDLTGVVADRYRIVRWLGGGGMGRVYEARDTELDERIALKVLRAGMDAERFRREVKLQRRIVHKNVARMFDIGEHAGEKFLTMELIEGGSLTGPLTTAQLVDAALQISAGLAAAHAAGVVHRDLKPDNVLVERATGRIAITDFGIARVAADDTGVTRVGEVVGTPRYMAPEQLAGQPVDARADIFALGVMLYELATGARPWSGDNVVAIAVAQATQPMRPLDARVPAELAQLIARCLAIDPAQRPSSVEVGAALAALGPVRDSQPVVAAPQVAMEATTIAVLPFEAAPADAYLAEGVREDLIDTLSTSNVLRVRPAGIVVAGTDPREVGRALAVDHVISGSVRRTGDQLRVSARLVGIADGFQIWAYRKQAAEAEILAISDEIAKGLAQALSTRAVTGERPTDPRAVELYLRARHELRRFWGDHAVVAADLLAEAHAIAPSSVPILAAYAYGCAQAYAKTSRGALLPRAREVVARALATGHGEAYVAAAILAWSLGENEQMAGHVATALVRAPMSATAHELAGRLLVEVGPIDEAVRHLELAVGFEPQRAPLVALELARIAALDGDIATEQRYLRQLSNDTDEALARIGAMAEARLAAWRGDLNRTLEVASTYHFIAADAAALLMAAFTRFLAGQPFDEAAWQLGKARLATSEITARQKLVTFQRAVETALIVGRPDVALEAMRLGNQAGLLDVTWFDRCPVLAPVRDLPAWRAERTELAARADRVRAAYRSQRASS